MSPRPSFLTPPASIRTRLLMALAALAASTLFVGLIAWYWLDRTNIKLEELRRQTLAEVARSLELAQRSSDLATSAPFLFNLKSSYLIETEGARLLRFFEEAQVVWVDSDAQNPGDERLREIDRQIGASLETTQRAVLELVELAGNLTRLRDKTRSIIAQLVQLERRAGANLATYGAAETEREGWRWLQSSSNLLAIAARAENYLSLGEYRRRFVALLDGQMAAGGFITGQPELARLERIANGGDGLFATRHKFLADTLAAHNALFRIRSGANALNRLVADLILAAQVQIGERRDETKNYITYAQISIFLAALASVSLALISALYVSGYVTGNINLISRAMTKLASGDHTSELPRKASQNDEIGNLLDAFRFFRANALRLNRSVRQLRRKTALFASIFDNINVGIAITDEREKLLEWNPHLTRVLNPEPAGPGTPIPKRGGSIADIVNRSAFSSPQGVFDPSIRKTNYGELYSEFGRVVEVRASPLPDGGAVWMFSDATERKRVEEHLAQFERLESLGQLTGEAAHDFNNVLSAIAGNIHLLEAQKIRNDKFAAPLHRIGSALEIGASLTQRLLAFARRQQLDPEIVELNELVEGVSELISFSLGQNVCLTTNLYPQNLWVKIDPGQLESALLNLCLNSSNAITGKGNVTISVGAGRSGAAEICVVDDGCGMSSRVLERAFEPFFSTRRSSKGSGLGLSMVFGFMKQSGGEVSIESKPGAGTRVTLALPRARALTQPAPETPPADSQRVKKVLLVEDDPATLKRANKMLQALGCEVINARGFATALEIMDGGQPYDVLFTDIQLEEGHSGWALVNRVLAGNAELKIIVTSGRFSQSSKAPDEFEGKVSLVAKPYTKKQLKGLLRV